MGRDAPAVFDQEWAAAVWDFVTGRDKADEALVRAHQAGWKAVAEAIRAGLGDIADAIRSHR
jgi:hypothetical protein